MTRLVSFYGDDFTGSTDVMESLATHSVETVLFTRMPIDAEFRPFTDCKAVGLAGTSRSQSPQWMDENLPDIFGWLKTLDAQFCHYKVCSTFDSSPEIGSIGRAIEIGAAAFKQENVPLIVGAPQLKRYTFAGHLFAGFQGKTYRIDRHPVMRNHPVTPMMESDVLVHLAKQTDHAAQLIDVYDAATQIAAGVRLQELQLPFVVGSSGVEYALMKSMRRQSGQGDFALLPAVAQTMVISGSVSPTTARQIDYACAHGFVGIATDVVALSSSETETARLVALADEVLRGGKSPLIYTALGPKTDVGQLAFDSSKVSRALGQILRQCIERHGLMRVMIAGGDTSSHALSELDIYALTTRKPLPETPGSPLCNCYSSNALFQNLEIAMKGGQVGGDDYFVKLRDGEI
jgi:3-oxoisoapionate kinase